MADGTAPAPVTSSVLAAAVTASAPPPVVPGAKADPGAAPVPDVKAVDTKPADAKPADAAVKPDAEIEVKFADSLKVSDDTAKSFKGVFKELGLDSAKSQKLVDAWTTQQTKSNETMVANWKQQQAKWVDEIKADKEIGGAAFDASMKLAGRAVREYGGDALLQRLDSLGLGDDPTLVRAFVKIGKAMAEDSIAGTSKSPPAGTAALDPLDLYPTMRPKPS